MIGLSQSIFCNETITRYHQRTQGCSVNSDASQGLDRLEIV